MNKNLVIMFLLLFVASWTSFVNAEDLLKIEPEQKIIDLLKTCRHSLAAEQKLAEKFNSVHFLARGNQATKEKSQKERAVLVSLAAGCKIIRDYLCYPRRINTNDKTKLTRHYRMTLVGIDTAVKILGFEAYKDLTYVNDFESYRAFRSVLASIESGLKKYKPVRESYFADYPAEISKIFKLMKQAGANLDEVIKDLPRAKATDAKYVLRGATKTIQKLLELTRTPRVAESYSGHDEILYFRFRHEVAFCLIKMKENFEKNSAEFSMIKGKLRAAYGPLEVEKNTVEDGDEEKVGFSDCMKNLKALLKAVSNASMAYRYVIMDIDRLL